MATFDITVQIILKPATHAFPANAQGMMKNACRYWPGDILDVYPAEKYATLGDDGNYLLNSPPGHPRFAFVHVKNVPVKFSVDRIKNKLTATVESEGGVENNQQLLRRRGWHIPPSITPVVFKQKLLLEKEATVDFNVAKNYIRKKVITDIFDPEVDNIDTVLIDEDLE